MEILNFGSFLFVISWLFECYIQLWCYVKTLMEMFQKGKWLTLLTYIFFSPHYRYFLYIYVWPIFWVVKVETRTELWEWWSLPLLVLNTICQWWFHLLFFLILFFDFYICHCLDVTYQYSSTSNICVAKNSKGSRPNVIKLKYFCLWSIVY